MKSKLLILVFFLILVYSGKTQNDTTFWNKKMLSIAYSDGGNEWLRIKNSNHLTKDDFFTKNSDAYRLSKNDNMNLISSKNDNLGYIHHLFQQSYNNVKIEGAEYKLHEKNGQIVSANGHLVTSLKGYSMPIITIDYALQNALHYVNATKYAWEVMDNKYKLVDTYPKGELVYTRISDSLPLISSNIVLAFKFDILAIEPYSNNYIYVDATTGNVFKTSLREFFNCHDGTCQTLYNGLQHITTYQRGVFHEFDYILEDDCRGAGIHTNWEENEVWDNDNTWDYTIQAATSAHWAAEKAWDYFYYTFGRYSYDNNGALLNIAVKDAMSQYHKDNSYWDGGNTIHLDDGDGIISLPLVSLDCVGHEFTHAVIQYEANLNGTYESGALGESFGDIFGTMVEFFGQNGVGDYTIGEDFWIPDGKMRDMSNPHSKGQPNAYQEANYWYFGTDDCGGVHTNCSVQNYWFYLLAEGGNGNNIDVQGIDNYKAAAIAYRSLTTYLISSSDYADAKNASIWAAMDLYGNCSNEEYQTIKAWNAVGVPSAGGFDENVTVNCNDLATYHQANIAYTGRAISNLYANCNIAPTTTPAPIIFIAGSSINLTNGFNGDINFHAYIDDCLLGNELKIASYNNNLSTNIANDPIIKDKTLEGFSVFPNPSNGIFTANITGDVENTTLRIYNIMGSLIRNEKVIKNNFTIDLKDYQKGIYTISVTSNKNTFTKKIIIQ